MTVFLRSLHNKILVLKYLKFKILYQYKRKTLYIKLILTICYILLLKL
jgi:hypothetical protein